MKDFDISLYGHLSYDRIFKDFKEINSVGCIGNVWHRLISLDCNLKINICPMSLGEALIYVDDSQSKRASVANLNLKTISQPVLASSKWHHILYLNELPHDLSWLNTIPKDEILSADVCKGKVIDLELVQNLDYLFISDEDTFHTMEELTKAVKGWVIMHHKSGSICSDGQHTFKVNIDPLSNINVLGAGDMFAATVMQLMIRNTTRNFEEIINQAHKDTKECLREK